METTPRELARELHVDAKRIRDWLRREAMTGHVLGQRWHIDEDLAARVRAAFRK